MSPPKQTIAIVINTAWNIYNFRVGLLRLLQASGYRIVAIAPHDVYAEKLEKLGFEYHPIGIDNKGTNPLTDLMLVLAFYRLYRRLQPDVLLHYTIKPNIYGTVAARLAGIPVISNISGLGTVFLNNSFSSRVARRLYRFALRHPRTVFFQNPHDRSLFVDSNLVAARKTRLLPGSGIDTQKFKPQRPERTGEGVSFLFIARLVRDKGLVEYIDAARILKERYPEASFNILGAYYPGNPTAITPTEMAGWEKEGIINYLGTSDEVAKLISQSDCVVLPSYREGLSRVLLEAASLARPLVTTDVPGCRDVVEDGVNGYLCRVRDAQNLADRMEEMIRLDSARREEMGRRGRDKVIAEFDEAIVIEHYQKAIDEILQ